MKKSWLKLAGVLLLAAFAFGCGKKKAEVVESTNIGISEETVALIVDEAEITLGDINNEVRRMLMQLDPGIGEAEREMMLGQMYNVAIDGLLTRQLVRNELLRSDIAVTPEEVTEAKRVMSDGIIQGGTLEEVVAAAGMTMEVFENNLKLDIFKNKVLQEAVAAVHVTEDDARAYYDANLSTEFTTPAGREVSSIAFHMPSTLNIREKRAKRSDLEDIRAQLLAGADFSEMAMAFSEHPSRINGGRLGIIPVPTPGSDIAAFQKAVYDLPIGQISEILETPDTIQIVVVTAEKSEEVVPFADISARLQTLLTSQAKQRVSHDYLQGLREKATIKFVGPLAPEVAETDETADDTAAEPVD